jgi:hypothetical protein
MIKEQTEEVIAMQPGCHKIQKLVLKVRKRQNP